MPLSLVLASCNVIQSLSFSSTSANERQARPWCNTRCGDGRYEKGVRQRGSTATGGAGSRGSRDRDDEGRERPRKERRRPKPHSLVGNTPGYACVSSTTLLASSRSAQGGSVVSGCGTRESERGRAGAPMLSPRFWLRAWVLLRQPRASTRRREERERTSIAQSRRHRRSSSRSPRRRCRTGSSPASGERPSQRGSLG